MTAEYERLRTRDGVHIWQGRAPDLLGPGNAALLSAAELEIVRRRSERAAVRYAGAHAALRRILAGYLSVPPERIRLGRQPCPRCAHPEHGRPRVDWPHTALDFNLSRSGSHWLVAVAVGSQVGADIEDGRAVDVEGSSTLVLADGELAHMRAQKDEKHRLDVFFRCWTRKEAVVKASGVGIAADLTSIDVRPAAEGPVRVIHTEPNGPDNWLVQNLPAAPGLFAALAREATSTGPVRLRDYLREIHGQDSHHNEKEEARAA
ncbi:4'-phosphopantetheinyl transferase superfamily protein [Streptomyces sp. ISL-96]|uniref:4'-phosphopantetheinyl transferase family protein n=1 Tax=Streptomyces sp. ISL-96 TaxID=2819191 RepID=UPI001BE7C870|nr:4'-phosphopantetheinyl transferase superfamily protein [Streptomyces sp. ISL-96]MBT2491919.1 4'-phosphopantetheinyl transferase superfamily protein [Streptomyces sp. ISL-96]